MKNKLLGLLIVALLAISPAFGASRLTTWSAGQVLTAANLNAEFDNVTVSGTVLRTGGSWNSADDVPVGFDAADPDARIEWETSQTVDSLVIGLGSGNIINIMELADMGVDWGLASQTNPTLFVHSADATATTDFISFTHDQTNAVIDVGSGSLTFVDDVILQGTTPLLTIGDAGTEDAQINFDGNATDYGFGLDDSSDDIVLADETALGTDNLVAWQEVGTGASQQRMIFYGANPATATDNDESYISFFLEDDIPGQVEFARLSYVALDTAAATTDAEFTFDVVIADSLTEVFSIGSSGAAGTTGLGTFTADLQISGTTPLITIGDAGTEDSAVTYDGAAQDYTHGIDDTTDAFTISLGAALGTTNALAIDSSLDITLGDATESDIDITWDGNAQDFYICLDDSSDDLVIGVGATCGTNDVISVREDDDVFFGTTAQLLIGNTGTQDGHVHILSPATSTIGLIVEVPTSSSVAAQGWHYNGVLRAQVELAAGNSNFSLATVDLGDDIAGPVLGIGQNNNVTNSNTGTLRFTDDGGTLQFIWVDNSASPGDVRVSNAAPESATSDTSGTVIGSQTSPAYIKNILYTYSQEPDDRVYEKLQAVLDTPIHDFNFKSGKYGQDFTGIAIPDGEHPWYGQDPVTGDDWAPLGTAKALNEMNMAGYLVLSIKALNKKITRLENEIHHLHARITVATN